VERERRIPGQKRLWCSETDSSGMPVLVFHGDEQYVR
jgi:hypothetical protein